MAEPLSDKIQSETLQPIIVNPITVDEYQDPSLLKPVELSQGNNIVLDDGVVEKIRGTAKLNSDTASTPVTGLHRSYGKDGTKKLVRISNGVLDAHASALPGASLLTGLSTSKITPFIDIQGRSYGVNQTDGIIRIDPVKNTAVKTGIVGPYLRKKIAFFESDETWIQGGASGNVSTDTDHYRSDEYSGNSCTSLKLSPANVGDAPVGSRTVSMDLTVFDNGKASTGEDIICFKVMMDNPSNLQYFTIVFANSNPANYYQLFLYSSDFENKIYEWVEFNIKRSAFGLNGAGTWTGIVDVRIGAKSLVGTGDLNVWVDSVYMKSAKPVAVEMRRQLAKCDSADGFTGAGTNIDNEKWVENNSSLKFTAAGAGTITAVADPLGSQVDLSTWPNGIASDTTDEIVFQIYVTDDTKIDNANPLIIKIGQSSTVYWTYTWTDKAALGISGRKGQWVEVRIAKSLITDGDATGIADWTAIDYLSLALKFGAASTAWIDDIHMEPFKSVLQLSTFESDESPKWTVVGTGNGKFTNENTIQGNWCLLIWGPDSYSLSTAKSSEWLIDWTGGVKDLEDFGGGVVSSASDYISFYLKPQRGFEKNIESLELWFDANSLTTFATAYKYTITPDMMTLEGKYINIKKSEFETVGTPADWTTIGAAKFKITGKGANNVLNGGGVYLDDMKLTRKIGQSGRYYYKYAFMVKDIYSACSEISEKVDAKGSYVVVSNVATSQDSRVTSRAIFRLGGAYTSTWMLVGKIEDNATTEFVDDVDDTDLVYPLSDEVPQGYINNVPCANLNYDPQVDRAIYWGDPTYKNRIYYSRAGFPWVVDEWAYREMPDDVMYVQPWYGQNIVIFKHTKKKINGDIASGELVDLPVTTGACSYYSVVKATMSVLVCVGQDNIYVFDGYKDTPIGNPVRNYVKGREQYQPYIVIGFHKDAVYVSVRSGTSPTYNNKVLRYYIPTKSWSILPNWNANVFCNFDKQNDNNEFYYGSSTSKNVFQTDCSAYIFNSTAITSTFGTGWINDPRTDLALKEFTLALRGTAGSVFTMKGYKNFDDSTIICTGSITLPATDAWNVYRFGPKNINNLLRGRAIKLVFEHSTSNAYFKEKDLNLSMERLSKRVVLNEVTVT